ARERSCLSQANHDGLAGVQGTTYGDVRPRIPGPGESALAASARRHPWARASSSDAGGPFMRSASPRCAATQIHCATHPPMMHACIATDGLPAPVRSGSVDVAKRFQLTLALRVEDARSGFRLPTAGERRSLAGAFLLELPTG